MEPADKKRKEVRVWVDGCFDMCHFGHANALRQAKQLGDKLIVGVHSDQEIERHKGLPVFYEHERYKCVRAIKWVDDVVEGSPYVTQLKTLDEYNCDFCAHGDDITTDEHGVDSYRHVKEAGKYKEFHRTEGVSTTDLVGRILLMTRTHHSMDVSQEQAKAIGQDASASSPYTGASVFLSTSQKIIQFSDGRSPQPGQKIAYVAGSWDLFHYGHVCFLENVAKLADFIIVGIHTDQDVNRYDGYNFPIMNVQERVLCVLACRYVSEVVIGAPFIVSKDLINHFKVDVVVHGESSDYNLLDGIDPYEVPKKMGIFEKVASGSDMSTSKIIERVIEHRITYEERNKRKQAKELRVLAALEVKKLGKSDTAAVDEGTGRAAVTI